MCDNIGYTWKANSFKLVRQPKKQVADLAVFGNTWGGWGRHKIFCQRTNKPDERHNKARGNILAGPLWNENC